MIDTGNDLFSNATHKNMGVPYFPIKTWASRTSGLISGFGKFCVKKKRERRGRNPATGEDMMLEARKVVTFKCSGQLRDKINKSQ